MEGLWGKEHPLSHPLRKDPLQVNTPFFFDVCLQGPAVKVRLEGGGFIGNHERCFGRLVPQWPRPGRWMSRRCWLCGKGVPQG